MPGWGRTVLYGTGPIEEDAVLAEVWFSSEATREMGVEIETTQFVSLKPPAFVSVHSEPALTTLATIDASVESVLRAIAAAV